MAITVPARSVLATSVPARSVPATSGVVCGRGSGFSAWLAGSIVPLAGRTAERGGFPRYGGRAFGGYAGYWCKVTLGRAPWAGGRRSSGRTACAARPHRLARAHSGFCPHAADLDHLPGRSAAGGHARRRALAPRRASGRREPVRGDTRAVPDADSLGPRRRRPAAPAGRAAAARGGAAQ